MKWKGVPTQVRETIKAFVPWGWWRDLKAIKVAYPSQVRSSFRPNEWSGLYCPDRKTIWINKSYLNAIDYDLKEFCMIITHELSHHFAYTSTLYGQLLPFDDGLKEADEEGAKHIEDLFAEYFDTLNKKERKEK